MVLACRIACRFLVLAMALAAAPAFSQAPGPERAWTFLVYAAVDNNAEEDGNFFEFLDRVRGAFADDPGMEIVLFIDRSTEYSTNAKSLGEDFTDTRLYRVRAGACTRLDGGEEFPEIRLGQAWEADSADPKNVGKFVAFGKARFPAKRYGLLLYGHADGRAMCPDEQSRREMGFAQLTDAVAEAQSVDLLGLELCNMGGIEIAYQWRPGTGRFSAKTLLAIPNAGPALDWSRVFARIRTGGAASGVKNAVDPASLTDQAFGSLIVEECAAARKERGENHEAVSSYDLSKAAAVKTAVDAWAVELARAGAKETLEVLRGPGAEGFALNYSRDRVKRVPLIDLADLAGRAAACERLDEKVRVASAEVVKATDAFVVSSWGGPELKRFKENVTGVFIIFPDGDDMVPARDGQESMRMWALCRFYSPLPVEGVYGQLAWCKDGATAANGKVENWFELLDSWFDDTSKAPEGANRYAP